MPMDSHGRNASAEKRDGEETTPLARGSRLLRVPVAERIKSSPLGTHAQVIPPLIVLRSEKELRQW